MKRKNKRNVFDEEAIINQLAQLKFNEINRPLSERETVNINGYEIMVSITPQEAAEDMILFGATVFKIENHDTSQT